MKQTQIRKTTARRVPAPVKVVEIPPAQKAGAAVHQAIGNGVEAVTDGISTGVGYVFGFVKGLVKGH